MLYNATHKKSATTSIRYADIIKMEIKEYPKQIEDIECLLGTHLKLYFASNRKPVEIYLPLDTKERFYLERDGRTIPGGTYPKIGEGAESREQGRGQGQEQVSGPQRRQLG